MNSSQFEKLGRWAVLLFGFGLLVFLLLRIESLDRKIDDSTKPLLNSRGKVIYPYQEREVKNTVVKYRQKMQDCFEQYMKTKPQKTAGLMHVEWNVSRDGSVHGVDIIASDFSDETFQKCVTSSIENWRFPKPGKEEYVEHRFRFQDPASFARSKEERGKEILKQLNRK